MNNNPVHEDVLRARKRWSKLGLLREAFSVWKDFPHLRKQNHEDCGVVEEFKT
jgi:hypothetical protein